MQPSLRRVGVDRAVEPEQEPAAPHLRARRASRGASPRSPRLSTSFEVLEYLALGMTEDEILRDFPDLTPEDIRACLAFAADRERKFVSVPPA